MKIALYIDEGREQIILTPETDSETAILGKLHDGARVLTVARGQFYRCQGGWTRHADSASQSTMLVLDRAPPPPERSGEAGA